MGNYYMPTTPGEYNPVQEILQTACTETFHVMSDTKKAAEIRDARESTFISTLAKALSAVLNEQRLSFFEKLAMENDTLPALYSTDVILSLRELRRKWKSRENGYKWDDFWSNECQSFILSLLATDDIMDLETERHRRALLAGKEEPRSDDSAWLEEEAKRQEAEANTLMEAAEAAAKSARLLADSRSRLPKPAEWEVFDGPAEG